MLTGFKVRRISPDMTEMKEPFWNGYIQKDNRFVLIFYWFDTHECILYELIGAELFQQINLTPYLAVTISAI